MNPWTGLLRKEFRLGRTGVLIALLVMAIYIGFSIYLSWKTLPGVLIGMSFMLIMAHIFYLPFYVGFSLHREKHTMHHWLHNPLSGNALLTAKFINGLVSFCFSLFIACLFFLYAWWTNKRLSDELLIPFQDVIGTGGFILVHIILFAIYLTLWTLMLSMLELVTKQKLGKWRGVIAVAIILFGPRLWATLEATSLYHFLTQWGPIYLANTHMMIPQIKVVYVGFYIFHLIIAIMLFALSSWMLDRKVEIM
ncbi:hypothetical protein BEP19_11505 [Ammoniphilus oxalaticus]|uniref:Uncharacterized protein n=1 Tax=Ammoniphilus oxalaticus TaxID=66863 RepID=A0A419SGE7_9BACL|nr:hypothetical protein [Ammoniphilus oxalaticus]RKD22857.1 hypothetical protein BEP19_11505 [Ammoniphilus oxalaticus]